MQIKKERLLKWLSFGCAVGIVPILAAATVLEKIHGGDFVHDHIYTALPLLLLWGTTAFASLLYLTERRLWRRPATFGLHLSFGVILVGALITHLSGRQGKLHLRTDTPSVHEFLLSENNVAEFPFAVSLKDFSLEYYDGTFAPSDFISMLVIEDENTCREGTVSMNKPFIYRHYRFYQSGYDADGEGAVLSVSHDPCGIAVTYTGYLWLLLSILGFFFERNSTFRRLLNNPSLRRTLPLLVIALLPASRSAAAPRTLPREVAAEFCNLHVYYDDRVCPLQTLAKDFTLKLCGRQSYEGLTCEQVLAGWFFFYDDWKNEPCIEIKGAEIARILGIGDSRARLTDFTDVHGYKLDTALRTDGADRRNAQAANEKFNLVSSLCTGSLLRIYPYDDPVSGNIIWYSLADRPSDDMPYEQWLFIRGSMDLVAERVAMHDNAGIMALLDKIGKYQTNEGGSVLPSQLRFHAEKCYNKSNADKPLAMVCLTLGILCFAFSCLGSFDYRTFSIIRAQKPNKFGPCRGEKTTVGRTNMFVQTLLSTVQVALLIYLTAQIGLRWFVSGHVPLTNGFETMHFMAWCGILLTLVLQRRFKLLLPFGFLLCGFTLLVAMMGESSPRITNLMPVLQSPLLSFHVMFVMVAYTLLALAMLNGLTAVILHAIREDASDEIEYLVTVSRIILYPALFCLAVGIFTGAVWANVSWGRYWGWDPKEVWALITLMVYSTALHTESLAWFRRPMFFHLFCITAFLTVLITYFGVNFILGGMHSYA